MFSIANYFMQNISTVNVKNIIFYKGVLILLSAVLAISIPYCAMYGLMNLANIQARNTVCEMSFVCFISCVCV